MKEIVLRNMIGCHLISWWPEKEKSMNPTQSSPRKEIKSVFRLALTLPWVSGLLAYPAEFGLANLHSHVRQFLNRNLSFSWYVCILLFSH